MLQMVLPNYDCHFDSAAISKNNPPAPLISAPHPLENNLPLSALNPPLYLKKKIFYMKWLFLIIIECMLYAYFFVWYETENIV